MNHKSEPKRLYRIIDNPADPIRPFALVREADSQVVLVSDRSRHLSDHAFDVLDADEVRHDENLVLAESRFNRRLA